MLTIPLSEIREDRRQITALLDRWVVEYGHALTSDRPFVEDICKALASAEFAIRCWESLNEPHP